MIKNLTCIVCPEGCKLEIDINNDYSVKGSKCNRGNDYGRQELINPQRMVTSTVYIENGVYARLPVKTSIAIPKELIYKCMEEINRVKVKSPVKLGDVIIHNVLNTGANIVACRNM